MRLESITLENFRSYRTKSTLDFEKPINIIIGRNNTGKSNILEFLRWISGAVSGQGSRPLAEYIHTGNKSHPFRAAFVVGLDDTERAALIDFYLSKTDGLRIGIDSLNLFRKVRIQIEADERQRRGSGSKWDG